MSVKRKAIIESYIDMGFIPFSFKSINLIKKENGKFEKDYKGLPSWKPIDSENYRQYLDVNQRCFALLTGDKGHLTVIDFDTEEAYQNAIKLEPNLTTAKTTKTRRGYHIYFNYDPQLKMGSDCFDSTFPQTDIRNDGSMIVCPPTGYLFTNQEGEQEWFEYEDMGGDIRPVPEIFHQHLKQPKISLSPKPSVPCERSTKIKLKSKTNPTQLNGINPKFEEIVTWVNHFSDERADDQKTWIEVGLCLHQIEQEIGLQLGQLLPIWVEFSQKSKKFTQGECEDKWNKFTYKDDGLHWQSLRYWAKKDDPNFKETDDLFFHRITLNTQSQTTRDVAFLSYQLIGQKFTYDQTIDKWYYYDHHHWIIDEERVFLIKQLGEQVINYYLNFIDQLREEFVNTLDKDRRSLLGGQIKGLGVVTYKLRDITFRKKIADELIFDLADNKFSEKLNKNLNLIGFDNGVYDLKKGEFRDGYPEDMISFTTGKDYLEFQPTDPKILAIQKFMSEVFPDSTIREYIYNLLASFLVGNTANEQFYFWTGIGSNGKSKLLELCECALGEYSAKVRSSLMTQKVKTQSSSATPELARLKGRRMVSAQEPDSGAFNAGLLKELSGGDKISVRQLYKNEEEFKPQFKFLVCCNKLPELPPDDEGTWRRARVIKFNFHFVKEPKEVNDRPIDIHLTEKIATWGEAFMFLLLEQYKIYQKNGLIEPEQIRIDSLKYRDSLDSVKEFIELHIVKKPSTSTETNFFCVVNAWNKYNGCDFKDPKMKKREFEELLLSKLGNPECILKKKYDGNTYNRAVMDFILTKDEEHDLTPTNLLINS
jgi:P4 family phage/plasmid primase-like protien